MREGKERGGERGARTEEREGERERERDLAPPPLHVHVLYGGDAGA